MNNWALVFSLRKNNSPLALENELLFLVALLSCFFQSSVSAYPAYRSLMSPTLAKSKNFTGSPESSYSTASFYSSMSNNSGSRLAKALNISKMASLKRFHSNLREWGCIYCYQKIETCKWNSVLLCLSSFFPQRVP